MKTKILIVTQDKNFRQSVLVELKKPDYEVHIHEDGEPLQAVFDHVPHLIVVDEDYAGQEGKRVSLAIKQDVVLKYIPIILVVQDKRTILQKDIQRIDYFFEKNHNVRPLMTLIHQTLKKSSDELDLNPVTHLPGTRSSLTRIEKIISSGRKFAVLCVDLSNLAVFNKAYGDSRGDEVIIRLSEILKKVLRLFGDTQDFLGHLGGDDFIIFTAPDFAVPISEAILQNFDSEIPAFYDEEDRDRGYLIQRDADGQLKQYPVMTISIAIVDNQHADFSEAEQVSQVAGQLEKVMRTMPGSCYALNLPPKKDASGKVSASHKVCFSGKMKSVLIPGLTTSPDEYLSYFSTILRERKIDSLYQPLVDARHKKIIGYEALSRPALYYPSEEATTLFAIARQLNQVKELDRLCVELSLKHAQALHHDQKLFINLNHETLLDSALMRDLFNQKGSIGFKNIVIEITEQSILRSFDKVREALAELKEQGVSVAIDDLGGGAVSLRDVAVLKPDFIKFDRSLIRQIDVSTVKQQILLSLILFARGIGALTVAEGIETREEYETTQACGIYISQGHYFAKPGPAFPKPVFGPLGTPE